MKGTMLSHVMIIYVIETNAYKMIIMHVCIALHTRRCLFIIKLFNVNALLLVLLFFWADIGQKVERCDALHPPIDRTNSEIDIRCTHAAIVWLRGLISRR